MAGKPAGFTRHPSPSILLHAVRSEAKRATRFSEFSDPRPVDARATRAAAELLDHRERRGNGETREVNRSFLPTRLIAFELLLGSPISARLFRIFPGKRIGHISRTGGAVKLLLVRNSIRFRGHCAL